MTAEALGRYEIVEELGRGATGGVFLAQDPERGRLVALKLLATGLGGTLRREAVLHEARTAGELDHPNIVAVHEAHEGERPFIVMEYVQGTDLREVLRPGKPLPSDFAIDVVEQVAEALDYAHSRGIIHRDVKPGNILITADETVKLTDFGIAAAPAAELPEARLGTAHYVAPEQLRGDRVDGRADVFSLGVVIYEMLTGRRPFEAESLKEVVRRVAEEPFTPPAEYGAALPPAVLKVIDRALAKEPGRRFASAGSLARSLRAAFEGREEVATRDLSDLLPELPARPARGRLLVWAAVTATLVAAASGWGLALMRDEPGAAADRAPLLHRVVGSHQELVREAEARLAAGDAMSAQRLAGLARRMAPHRFELAELETRATRLGEAQRAEIWRDGTVERLLIEAQQLRSAGNYTRALDALRRAAELDPEQPAVRQLIRQVEAARTHYLDSQTTEPPPVAVEPTFVAPPPPPAIAGRSAPLPSWSELRVDLYSRAPRGVLTLYSSGEQILIEPFRFGKRAGLLRRSRGAGRLEARRRLPAGDTELIVYVTLPGRPAVSWPLSATLPAGASRVLRILVAEDGELSVQLD